MPKPKRIYLLEVKYLGRRPYLAKGGGVFRSEKDMKTRIATVRSRAKDKGVEVEFTTSYIDAEWIEYEV